MLQICYTGYEVEGRVNNKIPGPGESPSGTLKHRSKMSERYISQSLIVDRGGYKRRKRRATCGPTIQSR